MGALIIQPTATAQWYACIHEAEQDTKLLLNEELESYLVFLLMRFIKGTTLINSIIAFDFMSGLQATKERKMQLLRDVGDKSLLFSSLFIEMAKRKRVSNNYFIDMGKAAYLSVSDLSLSSSAKLYFELSQQFTKMQQILQAIRGQSDSTKKFSPNFIK